MKRTVLLTLVLTLLGAAGAFAQGHGGGPDHGPGGPEGFGGPAIIGSDGTVYVTKASSTAGSVDIVAVTTAGSTAWTATVADDHARPFLSNGNLLVTSDTRNSDNTITSTITALSTSTGAVAWTKTFSGHADPIGTFSGGTYVSVVVPPTTQGGTATRSLVALSNSGAVLWTLAL